MDKILIQKCIKQDRRAQYELYKLCHPLLMGICLRYKKNESDALAILNEGFLKILNNLEKYNSNVPFEAWSKRIMINTIIDEFRKYRKTNEMMEYADMSVSRDYDQTAIDYNLADQQFDADQIQSLIEKLPPVSQKVFNLYAIDGFSHKEIAEMLDISVGTSKWHLSFSRGKIKEMIQELLNSPKVT